MVFYDRMTVRNYDKNIHIPQLLQLPQSQKMVRRTTNTL